MSSYPDGIESSVDAPTLCGARWYLEGEQDAAVTATRSAGATDSRDVLVLGTAADVVTATPDSPHHPNSMQLGDGYGADDLVVHGTPDRKAPSSASFFEVHGAEALLESFVSSAATQPLCFEHPGMAAEVDGASPLASPARKHPVPEDSIVHHVKLAVGQSALTAAGLSPNTHHVNQAVKFMVDGVEYSCKGGKGKHSTKFSVNPAFPETTPGGPVVQHSFVLPPKATATSLAIEVIVALGLQNLIVENGMTYRQVVNKLEIKINPLLNLYEVCNASFVWQPTTSADASTAAVTFSSRGGAAKIRTE